MTETVAALLGVALGRAFSLIWQWMGSARADRLAREAALRQARVAAISDFARAVVEYRMTALTRGLTRLQSGETSSKHLTAHRQARASAWHAY